MTFLSPSAMRYSNTPTAVRDRSRRCVTRSEPSRSSAPSTPRPATSPSREAPTRESGVAIYTNAKGSPKIYGAEDLHGGYWSATYDNDGNLFVEATPATQAVSVCSSFPRALSNSEASRWNGIRPPHLGSIQWDGQYLAAESPERDPERRRIFRYSVSRRASHIGGQDGAQGRRKPAPVLDSRRENRRAQSERLGRRYALRLSGRRQPCQDHQRCSRTAGRDGQLGFASTKSPSQPTTTITCERAGTIKSRR